jgi:DNA polymerase-3 subunit delta'
VSSLDQFTSSFDQLRRAWSEHRLAHAYLISGSPSGAGLTLVQALLKLLYCTGADQPCGVCANCHRVENRQHPDVSWLEPEKKSRIISVDQIRALNLRLSQTAYAGGWKVGVILACDRLKEEAANAFLKTLEEPPGRTLLLLVTDQIQAILPTIISRCQKVVLEEGTTEPVWMQELLGILQQGEGDSGFEALLLAGRLRALLESIKAGILEAEKTADDSEEAKDVLVARVQAKLIKERTELLRTAQFWQRDLLACRCGADEASLHFKSHATVLRRQAGSMTTTNLLRRVSGVEQAVRRMELNVSDVVALESYLLASSGRG